MYPRSRCESSSFDKLNAFLQFNERDILQNAGKVTAVIAKEFAISEFEKYKVIQDKSYKSDFDMLLQELDKDGKWPETHNKTLELINFLAKIYSSSEPLYPTETMPNKKSKIFAIIL